MTYSLPGFEPLRASWLTFRWRMNSMQSSMRSVSKDWKFSLPPGSVESASREK